MSNAIDKKKLLETINGWITTNYEFIDSNLDGDSNCKQEIGTLENVVSEIESGRYDVKKKDMK